MTMSPRHLDLDALEARFRAAKDVIARSHLQVIWLLAQGHTTAGVAEVVATAPRWVGNLARRYERDGVDALGDRRRRNAGAKPLLPAEDLEALRERLRAPPDDGGLWTSAKAARWIAGRTGLAHVHVPRGWEALKRLDWSLQAPRPKHPRAAGPAEAEAFERTWPTPSPRRPAGARTSRSRSGRRTSTGSA